MVSIVITHYNYHCYLEECLSSCLAQEEVKSGTAEIVVVDDNSKRSPEYILEHYPVRFKVLSENKGYSHAKNVGIRMAKGEHIVFLDADDCLVENSIKCRLDAIDGYDMVHARAWRYRNGLIDGYNKNAKVHAQTIMMRKDVFDRFGLFYEGLRSKADKEMNYRLGVHPRSPFRPRIKVNKIKDFVALYRKHDQAMHKLRKVDTAYNNEVERVFKERIEQLKKEGITKENTEWI